MNNEVIIFGPSLDEVKKKFKYDLNYGLEKVEKFISQIAKDFEPIFHISPEPEEIKKHPLFKKMHEEMERLVPSITFEESEGIIERWKIRHVIFRKETIVQIIESIDDKEKLRKIGEDIGISAAKDLFKNVIENKKSKCIPDSLASFISLFDYWDRTGGWGKIVLEESSLLQSSIGEWHIITHNNFLAQADHNKTHLSCNFWCGYFKGILNYSLNRLATIISELDSNLRKQISIPQFVKVTDVVHFHDKDPIKDKFIVYFESHEYSHLLQMLMGIQNEIRELNKNDGYESRIFALCHTIITDLYQKHIEKFNFQYSLLDEVDQSIISKLNSSDWTSFRKDRTLSVFNVTNLFLQSFLSIE